MSQGVKTTPTHTPNNTGIEHMHAYAEDTQTRRHIEKTDALYYSKQVHLRLSQLQLYCPPNNKAFDAVG